MKEKKKWLKTKERTRGRNEKRGSNAANRRSSSQKELFSVSAFRQSKTRTNPPSSLFLSLLSVSTFHDLLARIMKARILRPIVPDSTMPDIVYFFHRA